MNKEVIKYSLSEIKNTVTKFIFITGNYKIFACYGDMGAGKTTFIKAFCKAKDCVSEVSSPTYSLINEYHTSEEKKIYHADLFRLKNIEEALNIGIEDYLNEKDSIIFIEWAQVIEALLPENTVSLHFETISPTERTLTINLP